MIRTLIQLMTGGNATAKEMFPDLPEYSRGLPGFSEAPCDGCGACALACPTSAIQVTPLSTTAEVTLDRGKCIACGLCVESCPTGTLVPDRGTRVSTSTREDLVIRASKPTPNPSVKGRQSDTPRPSAPGRESAARPFRRSLHVREVSTGDNASDTEVQAANNPIFDASRFGIHVVASPRFADALVVTGPVGVAMREPLLRCYEAMAEPKIVIAVGAGSISGEPFAGGYANACGVDAVLPVSVYVPGNPPHPWYILHGLLTAMGHPILDAKG